MLLTDGPFIDSKEFLGRFGTVFAIAIATAVFSAHGHLGTPAAVTAGFKPALWACAAFAVLAALTSTAITSPTADDQESAPALATA